MQQFKQVKTQCIDYFGGLFCQCLSRLPELLTEHIAAADSDRARNRYLDARIAFEEVADRLAADYRSELDRLFDDPMAELDPSKQDQNGPARLCLVDKEQFEDDVAIRAIATRVGALHTEELWQLNRRMAVLRGGTKFCDEGTPCGPLHLCRAAQGAFRALEVEPASRLFFYKVYQASVLGQIGKFYQQLNEKLAAYGILKNLGFDLLREPRAAAGAGASATAPAQRVAPQPQPVTPAAPPAPRTPPAPQQLQTEAATSTAPVDPPSAQPSTRQSAANDTGSTPHTDTSATNADQIPTLTAVVSPEIERRQSRVFNAIRSLQHKRNGAGQPRTQTEGGANYGDLSCDGSEGSLDTFAASDIATAVGRLQATVQLPNEHDEQADRVGNTEERLLHELGNFGYDCQRQKITATDADTIDLVGMLFDYMLSDPLLPLSVKALLSHLHTPYLKVALLDPVFFAQATHPARRLLDLLAAAGVRWLQEGGTEDKVYHRIRHLVKRIIAEFDNDVRLFEELLNDFVHFVRVLEKRAELAERRCRETEKGQDKLNQARGAANREIEQRIEGIALTAQVRQLLAKTWVDFLVYTHLRQGEHSDEWRAALSVVDEVVSTTRPRAADAPAPSTEALARLTEQINTGLLNIGCDEQRRNRLLQAVREAQTRASSVDSAAAGTSPIARRAAGARGQRTAPGKSAATNSESTPPQYSQREQKLAQQLSAIEFGTWFEFQRDGESQHLRLKLSWYSSVSGNYMFVDATGVKRAVHTLAELVRGLNAGTIAIVDKEQKGLFERALSSVLSRLKRR